MERAGNLSKGEVTNGVEDDIKCLAMVRYQPILVATNDPALSAAIELKSIQRALSPPAASIELSRSAPTTSSTPTKKEQAGNLSKSEINNVVQDADNKGLAMVRYELILGASFGRRGGIDIPAFASSSTFKNKGVVAKRVSNVPVLSATIDHHNVQRVPTLDITAFLSPQLESESVFKTFMPDVDPDGNRLSAILDQPSEFLDGATIPHSAVVVGLSARFRRKAYRPIIKTLVQTVGEDSLDDLVLEPREVQKGASFTLMEKCMTISIPVRSSPIIQGEPLSGQSIFSYHTFISVIDDFI